MLPVRGRVLPVLLAAVVLVGGANLAAYAANGHPLLLGHANSESQTATLANTGSGPALTLQTSKKSAPLAVSSAKVVKHLNADSVDGQGASALQTQATTWSIPDGTTLLYQLNGLKPGRYLATMSVLLHATDVSFCGLDEGMTTSLIGYGVNRAGTFSLVSGTGIIAHRKGQPLTLFCQDADAVGDGTNPSTVTLVRLDHVTTGTATPTFRSAPRPTR